MKKLLYVFILLLGLSHHLQGQVITGPTGYSWFWYANGGSTSACYLTVRVTNTNTFPIMVTDVGNLVYTTNQLELWYSSTSLTGAPGVIAASNPAWIQLKTVPAPTTTGTINNTLYSGLNLIMPAGATYRFAIVSQSTPSTTTGIYFGSTTNPATVMSMANVTLNGVTIDINNAYAGYTDGSVTYGPIGGYGFYGSVTVNLCPYKPSGLGASNIKSTSANVFWNAVANSTGYDYIVSTSATAPSSGFTSTTGTSATVTGLTPGTTYYLYVRNKCSATNSSEWERYQFDTPPPCSKPTITITDVKETSAKISWTVAPNAQNYEFVLDQLSTNPLTPGAPSTGTESPTGLQQATKYYVHVKMNCKSGEQSEWTLDSFTTSFICLPPVLEAEYEHIDRAIVYWKPVLGAIAYEYEISQSPTPLGTGTEIKNTSFFAFPLKDGQVYYFHARTSCDDRGYKSKSEWGTTSFRTFATSVSNVSGSDLGIVAYPNPVTNTLTIKNSGRNPLGAISITDVSGKVVYTGALSGNTKDIDMSSLTGGVYLLKYVSAEGGTQVIRVTKQ
ncbi:MAG: T9SS type A sorting domain-containing protein [Sphingobacteriales bacterium]|nr:MAG: T9SS type A sorting domain-containing protein [Sphingobacteriales bacterium]